jgi:hypothetical protein
VVAEGFAENETGENVLEAKRMWNEGNDVERIAIQDATTNGCISGRSPRIRRWTFTTAGHLLCFANGAFSLAGKVWVSFCCINSPPD